MTKVDILRLDSVTNNDTTATATINTNFQRLQTAIENTLSRDGTTPNFMDADLDMNSYKIINAGEPENNTDVITKGWFDQYVEDASTASSTANAAAAQAQSSAQTAAVSASNALDSSYNANTAAVLAQEWATKMNDKVNDEDYSAKQYASWAHPYTAGDGITIDGVEISTNITAGDGLSSDGHEISVDTDEVPTEDSDKLLTSGAVYDSVYNLQQQIDAITSSSDVHDIVGTKAALDAYDTTSLNENDIIKVLQDETQSNATTYYRWDGSAFTLIGAEGPYYTQSAADNLFSTKANTGYALDISSTVLQLQNNSGTPISTLNVSDVYPVVETYVNGSSWYRVYSDGWVEQGGQLSSLGTVAVTVTLLKPFADTNYTVSSCGHVNSTTGQYGYLRDAPTTTTIKFKGTGTVTNFYWMACGYGA